MDVVNGWKAKLHFDNVTAIRKPILGGSIDMQNCAIWNRTSALAAEESKTLLRKARGGRFATLPHQMCRVNWRCLLLGTMDAMKPRWVHLRRR